MLQSCTVENSLQRDSRTTRSPDATRSPRNMQDRVVRFTGAVALTVLGATVALILQRVFAVPDGLVFAATVAVCARFFGTGPSLLASALSVVAIDLTLLPPIGTVEFTHPEEL